MYFMLVILRWGGGGGVQVMGIEHLSVPPDSRKWVLGINNYPWHFSEVVRYSTHKILLTNRPLAAGDAATPLEFYMTQKTIDLMHMTSQKGAPACWGSNEALSRAPSASMQPAGQPLHAIPPGPGPAHWLRGWERQRSPSTTRARSATSLDPQHGVVVMETWRQCIRSIAKGGKRQLFWYEDFFPPLFSFCVVYFATQLMSSTLQDPWLDICCCCCCFCVFFACSFFCLSAPRSRIHSQVSANWPTAYKAMQICARLEGRYGGMTASASCERDQCSPAV